MTLKKRGKAEVNSGSFPAPPARQRKALKLEIPATTEWTEREGTCLGRRNCPFSASMHLFGVLYCADTFSLVFFILFNLFCLPHSLFSASTLVVSLAPVLSLSSLRVHVSASGGAVSACVRSVQVAPSVDECMCECE